MFRTHDIVEINGSAPVLWRHLEDKRLLITAITESRNGEQALEFSGFPREWYNSKHFDLVTTMAEEAEAELRKEIALLRDTIKDLEKQLRHAEIDVRTELQSSDVALLQRYRDMFQRRFPKEHLLH